MFSKQFSATIFLILASIIWGTAFVAQTTGMEFIGPLTFINVRFIIGTLIILPLAFFERDIFFKVEEAHRKKLYFIIFLTGCSLFVGSFLQQYALQYTKVGNAAFLTILYVPFVPIISRFFLGKKIHWSIWVSVSICLLGSYYLSTGNSFEAQSADILVALCAVFFALHCIFIDEFFEIINAPFSLAFYQFGICFILSFPLMFIFEEPSFSGIYQEIGQLLYVGIMSTGVAYTFQIIGQRYVKPSTAVVTLSLEGVFAALTAWIILTQMLSSIQIIGCTLIIVGVLVAQLIPLMNKDAASQRYHDN
jgi:drug/metabolite transporter (DMT)-like permease